MAGRTWMRKYPHTVYVVTSSDGDVLYVGQSVDAPARIYQHSVRSKEWFGLAAHVSYELYQNWQAAKHIEGLRIAMLDPVYNNQRETWAAAQVPAKRPQALKYWEEDIRHG